jgi:hypothetical protein
MRCVPFLNWWHGNRKYDECQIHEEPWFGTIDYRELGPEFYRTNDERPENCALCVWYRTERRKLFLQKRSDLCFLNSPWWPTPPECRLYRARTVPLKEGGWDMLSESRE